MLLYKKNIIFATDIIVKTKLENTKKTDFQTQKEIKIY